MTNILKINYSRGCDLICENCPRYFQCQSDKKYHIYERGRMDLVTKKLEGIIHKIAVIGGKGGVGKSTVSANLAVALARNFSVGIIDSDFDGPSIPRIMGVMGEKMKMEDGGIIPVEGPLGIKVVSTGFIMDEDDVTTWFHQLKRNALEEFLCNVEYGSMDYLILDLPPGTSSETMNMLEYIRDLDGVVIVTIPSELSQNVARRAIRICQIANARIIGVIENMSGHVCSQCGHEEHILQSGGGERLAQVMGVPFLGKIPLDARVSTTSDNGIPFIIKHAESKVAQCFAGIVGKIIEAVDNKQPGQTQ